MGSRDGGNTRKDVEVSGQSRYVLAPYRPWRCRGRALGGRPCRARTRLALLTFLAFGFIRTPVDNPSRLPSSLPCTDPTTHLITLTTSLTTLFIHPTSPSTSTLYLTLLTLLSPAPSSALPLTPPASPSPNSPTSPTLSTSSSSTSAKSAPRRRAPPPSSFHTRPVSQASAHSAHSTQSVSSIRSVSSFRAGWEPVWVKDEDCVGCQECGEGWTWSRRRHHCRGESRLTFATPLVLSVDTESARPCSFGPLFA